MKHFAPKSRAKSPWKIYVLALLGIMAGAGGAWIYQNWREPLAGGPGGDGFWARRLKTQIQSQFSSEQKAKFAPLTPENANGWYFLEGEPVQSFAVYQSQNPTRPTPSRRVFVLQPLGEFSLADRELLPDLRLYSEAFFQIPTRLQTPVPAAKLAPFARKGGLGKNGRQLDAGRLISEILKPNLPPDAALQMGIASDDLHAEGLSFVFGLATWRDRVGVFSTARYFPRDSPTLSESQRAKALRRAAHVLNHEAGHMLGLRHCTVFKCSMNGSNSLPDSDQTPLEFCPLCRQKLAWNIGYDAQKREKELADFYRKHGLLPFLNEIKD